MHLLSEFEHVAVCQSISLINPALVLMTIYRVLLHLSFLVCVCGCEILRLLDKCTRAQESAHINTKCAARTRARTHTLTCVCARMRTHACAHTYAHSHTHALMRTHLPNKRQQGDCPQNNNLKDPKIRMQSGKHRQMCPWEAAADTRLD